VTRHVPEDFPESDNDAAELARLTAENDALLALIADAREVIAAFIALAKQEEPK
jgi:hypothetical protein